MSDDPTAAPLHDYSQITQPALLQQFWRHQNEIIEQVSDFKNYELPLARIKKIMKTDEEVRAQMISAEAPVLFTKACELFILELTLRSWLHTEENKRKTLQKNDISAAVSQSDMYDFLIDIVPREDIKSPKKMDDGSFRHGDPNFRATGAVAPDLTHYYYQMAQQQVMQHPQADQIGQRGPLVDPYLIYQQQQHQQHQHYSSAQPMRYYHQHPQIMHQLQMSDQHDHQHTHHHHEQQHQQHHHQQQQQHDDEEHNPQAHAIHEQDHEDGIQHEDGADHHQY